MRMECVRTELPQTKLNGVTSTSVLWSFRWKYILRIQSINSTHNQYCIFKTKALNSVLLLIFFFQFVCPANTFWGNQSFRSRGRYERRCQRKLTGILTVLFPHRSRRNDGYWMRPADPSFGMVILDSVNRDCARNNLHCTPIFLIRLIWRYCALLLRDKVKLLKKSSNPQKHLFADLLYIMQFVTIHLLSLWWMLCCPHSPPPLLSPLLQIKGGTYW